MTNMAGHPETFEPPQAAASPSPPSRRPPRRSTHAGCRRIVRGMPPAFTHAPTLSTDRLVLDAHRPDDLDALA
ncbi:hypothetical protein ABI055_14850, partial [Enterococcus faecium]|uniref:hypothetical protein n=1 Tax=Enterococcus faecium TaxID=1352 RepID=UPI003F41D663